MSDDPAFASEPAAQTIDLARVTPSNNSAAVFREIRHARSIRLSSELQAMQDVELTVSIELGRARMQLRDVLSLGRGTVLELDKEAGDPVDVVVNGQTVARGEVVVADGRFAVRITEVLVER